MYAKERAASGSGGSLLRPPGATAPPNFSINIVLVIIYHSLTAIVVVKHPLIHLLAVSSIHSHPVFFIFSFVFLKFYIQKTFLVGVEPVPSMQHSSKQATTTIHNPGNFLKLFNIYSINIGTPNKISQDPPLASGALVPYTGPGNSGEPIDAAARRVVNLRTFHMEYDIFLQ